MTRLADMRYKSHAPASPKVRETMRPLPPYLARLDLRVALLELKELIREAETQLANMRRTAARLEAWNEAKSREDDTVNPPRSVR